MTPGAYHAAGADRAAEHRIGGDRYPARFGCQGVVVLWPGRIPRVKFKSRQTLAHWVTQVVDLPSGRSRSPREDPTGTRKAPVV